MAASFISDQRAMSPVGPSRHFAAMQHSGSFMADMKAYHAEDNPLKRDEIAARQVRVLNERRRPRDLKMRLVDVKNLFELVRGEG